VHNTLAFHWARLIELLYATERAIELITDPDITSDNIRAPLGEPGEGVGIVEAARGTLIHHYKLTPDALMDKVNLIVATTNNKGAICMSVREAAKAVIKDGNVDEGLLNMVEMAFRAYDPCFACASHTLPGGFALEIKVFDAQGDMIKSLKNF
jgi:F420-non-reducing hydrogenase large subunit